MARSSPSYLEITLQIWVVALSCVLAKAQTNTFGTRVSRKWLRHGYGFSRRCPFATKCDNVSFDSTVLRASTNKKGIRLEDLRVSRRPSKFLSSRWRIRSRDPNGRGKRVFGFASSSSLSNASTKNVSKGAALVGPSWACVTRNHLKASAKNQNWT
ncbi:hypothetical protein DL96DRAFT_806339 [Flagelloscypha sp. PMI_526]|nr:hypothetical protein DL96DRAFT_806339 [Flagelloscypha sp. PMI_526]